MRVLNFRKEKRDIRVRSCATVIWEDSGRPNQEIYFETTEKYGERLSPNPNAFLIGSILPALRHNEKRIYIDEEVCHELKDNLHTVMEWLRLWYHTPDKELIKIESKKQYSAKPVPMPISGRTGMFFSGGVDSLGTLRANHLNYSPEHPGFIKEGLMIYGQNIESNTDPETFEKAVTNLSAVATDSGLVLIPVYTNVRQLDEDSDFFCKQFHGAIMGATAHVFSKCLDTVIISATDDFASLAIQQEKTCKPWGSHPLLDPNYSSNDLRLRHQGLNLSRLDKIRLIADWDVALQNIKVCAPNFPGSNCGKCEKCIRTQLGLLAVGKLDKTNAFPLNDLSEDHIRRILPKPDSPDIWSVQATYLQMIPPLKEKGRDDLVRAVGDMIERSNNLNKNKMSLKSRIWAIDQKYFNGMMTNIKHKTRRIVK